VCSSPWCSSVYAPVCCRVLPCGAMLQCVAEVVCAHHHGVEVRALLYKHSQKAALDLILLCTQYI